jgi:amidohydrolase
MAGTSALRSLRHRLHANPYAAGSEGFTAAAIYNFLRSNDVEVIHTNVGGGFGMVAKVEGRAKSLTAESKSILLRADMDALPLTEETPNIPHVSQNLGYHHACGHDGHSVMLAGALSKLQSKANNFEGTVYGIFQPAEETGEGALQMLQSKLISQPTNGCYGLHNIPGEAFGKVMLTKQGVAARASCGLRFQIEGTSSHASEPHKGNPPFHVLSSLIGPNSTLSTLPEKLLQENLIDSQKSNGLLLATPVFLQIGCDGDFGILPANGTLNITCRADKTEDLSILKDAIYKVVQTETIQGGCRLISMDVMEPFPAVVNDERRTKVVEQASEMNGLKLHEMSSPFPWSEDFAYFGEYFETGATLFGLGSGENHPPLHSKEYDFNDDLIPIGVKLWESIAKIGLQQDC